MCFKTISVSVLKHKAYHAKIYVTSSEMETWINIKIKNKCIHNPESKLYKTGGKAIIEPYRAVCNFNDVLWPLPGWHPVHNPNSYLSKSVLISIYK